jgi:iron complex transport system ATP-binding protein
MDDRNLFSGPSAPAASAAISATSFPAASPAASTAGTGSALLRAEGLAVGYPIAGKGKPGQARRVLAGLDLELRAGELVCLLGPNGAGKSTLLRTLAGLQSPLDGRLLVDGRDSATLSAQARARKTAIVLTERISGGNLTVGQLAALGRHPHTGWSGRLREADRTAIHRALEEAGAWELRERLYDELSDGEKQRVMLARALAQEPAVLLLDEPTAFLDFPRRVETMRVLRDLARERRRAVLLSTHDLDLAMRAADRLWLVSPGGAVRTGLPEDLALQGALGSVFDQGDVAFDTATGQFRIHGHPTRSALLDGDPVPVFWTGRALERLGYSVAATAPGAAGADTKGLRVSAWAAKAGDAAPRWECRFAGLSADAPAESFANLEAMVDRLRG